MSVGFLKAPEELACSNQHNTHWIPDGSNPCYEAVPGAGHVLVLNNGRVPDREFTTADEFALPETAAEAGGYERAPAEQAYDLGGFKAAHHVWSFGAKKDHVNCDTFSICRTFRLANP